jgi:hypothetical protein
MTGRKGAALPGRRKERYRMQKNSCRFPTEAASSLIVLLAIVAARPAAAVGRQLDLATMAERAGTIVSGRIVQLRPGSHPKYPNVGALFVTVKVNEMMKGTPAEKLTFMQFSGRAAASERGKSLSLAQTLPDLPTYRVGEEVVLFLYPPSSVGFTSPVGGSQGMFIIHRDPNQPASVISEGGNRSLAVPGALPSRLPGDQQNLLRHPGDAMDLRTFSAAVKSLVVKPK